jgi:hypothetical protein
MARRKPGTPRRPTGIVRFARDENGKVSIVSILAVMAIFGMIGLVANTGRVAREKIELQTAADAAAATTTLWLARSMNAVTTANHLMGEATAVLVLLDGLGGPDFPISPPVETPRNKEYNATLKNRRSMAPATKVNPYTRPFADWDRKLVHTVVDQFTLDDGKTRVAAALYDAKLTLKFVAATCLTMKFVMNALQPVAIVLKATGLGAKLGKLIEVSAALVHGAASVTLTFALQEWLFLQGIEKVLITVGPPIRTTLLKVVLPGLSRYSDTVVGTAGRPGGMNRAIRQSLDALKQEHNVASLEIVPPVDELRLPLEREAAVVAAGGEQPQRGWKGNYETPGMRTLRQFYQATLAAIEIAVMAVEFAIEMASLPANAIGGFADVVTGGNAPPAVEEIRKIQREFDKLKDVLRKATTMPDPPDKDGDGFDDNPARAEARLPAFDWEAERRSQWARATHPYVDDYRAPVIRWFRDQVSWSNAATYLVNWTDRYTLVRSYQLRGDPERTHMYVMREMKPAEKGREPWVADARAAADLFAVVAVATREPAAVWLAPRVFGAPGGRPAAVAGGLLYNANGNRVSASAAAATQPDTGWDTLNWQPPVTAPEWGWGRPTIRTGDPLAVFKSSKPSGPKATVRLNWQGKLVPADRGLLGRAKAAEADVIRRHERLLKH